MPTIDLEQFEAEMPGELPDEPPAEFLAWSRGQLVARRFDPTRKPPEVVPVYSLGSAVICTPGNLTAITSAIKTGKSAFIGAMIAAPIATDTNADTFCISSRNPEGFGLVHIDTEQSPDDHWTQIDRALRRAGTAEMPPWLFSYCLTGYPANDVWSLTKQAIADAAQTCGGMHAALIDGGADLVNDVNDPEECNAFVAELHGLAIKQHCPIVSVIHFNPGSEKTRGHLGSQLERKAETNLTLKKDDEITVAFSVKQRREPIPEEYGPRFRWCPEKRMHVSANIEDSPKHREKLDALRMERDDVFKGRQAMRYSEMVSTLKTLRNWQDRNAEKHVAAWKSHRLIESNVAGLYTPTS